MTRNALHRGVVLAAALAALAGSSLASSCSSFESALQRFWNFGIEPRAPFSYALGAVTAPRAPGSPPSPC